MKDRLPEPTLLCPQCGTPTQLKGPSQGPGAMMTSYRCPKCHFRAWIPPDGTDLFTRLALEEGPEGDQ